MTDRTTTAQTTGATADVTPAATGPTSEVGTAEPATGPTAEATADTDHAATNADDADADEVAAAAAGEADKPRRGRPKGGGARNTRTVELTLTVSGTADGDWQAELRHGTSWITRGLPVSAAAVSRAAKELHDELAGPIDEMIQAARSQHEARIAALEAELEQARKALAELAG